MNCPHCGHAIHEKGEVPSFKEFWSPPRRAEEVVPVRSAGSTRVEGVTFTAEQAALLARLNVSVTIESPNA